MSIFGRKKETPLSSGHVSIKNIEDIVVLRQEAERALNRLDPYC